MGGCGWMLKTCNSSGCVGKPLDPYRRNTPWAPRRKRSLSRCFPARCPDTSPTCFATSRTFSRSRLSQFSRPQFCDFLYTEVEVGGGLMRWEPIRWQQPWQRGAMPPPRPSSQAQDQPKPSSLWSQRSQPTSRGAGHGGHWKGVWGQCSRCGLRPELAPRLSCVPPTLRPSRCSFSPSHWFAGLPPPPPTPAPPPILRSALLISYIICRISRVGHSVTYWLTFQYAFVQL